LDAKNKLIVLKGGGMHAGLKTAPKGTIAHQLWGKNTQPYGKGTNKEYTDKV